MKMKMSFYFTIASRDRVLPLPHETECGIDTITLRHRVDLCLSAKFAITLHARL